MRGGVAYGYTYDARGRPSGVSVGGVAAGRYGYDAFGRRAWREAAAGAATIRRHYLFDGHGRLLAEHDADTGAAVREYVWLDDTPVALIDRDVSGQPRLLHVHAGQLNEPLAMTDAAGATVWSAIYEPFSAATVTTADPALDLRLPGQELQAETGGLHQNWHRDYDPSLGRYVQADPVGLEAGPNPYAYVDGDPLNAVDPEGLAERGRRIGNVIGAGIGAWGGATAGGAAGAVATAPTGPGAIVGAGAGAAAGAAAGGIIGFVEGGNLGSDIEDLILMRRGHGGSGSGSRSTPERGCPDDRACTILNQRDRRTCSSISRRFGEASGAVCMQTASQRYAECLAGGYANVRTPLFDPRFIPGSPPRSEH